MTDANTLVGILKTFGVAPGSTLIFEAGSSGLEELDGGMAALVSSLQDLLGQEGTLVVPTCTPREGSPKPTFDPALSPSEMGSFSEFFRKLPKVVRSHSPTHSIAVWGSNKEEIIEGHRFAGERPTPWGEGPFGKGSPWDKLYQKDAWWVMVGDLWEETPFIPYVLAMYTEQHNGITKRTPFPEIQPITLGQKLGSLGLSQEDVWGSWPILAFRLKVSVDQALQTLEKEPRQLNPSPKFAEWLDIVSYIQEKGYLQAGSTRVDITPPIPFLRWEGTKLTGIFRELYARALVLSHDNHQVALVVCDLLGISRELVEQIRERVSEKIGIAKEAIQVACTHSHSTPDTLGSGYEDPQYLNFLVERVATAVCQAATTQQPARMGWGKVPIRGLATSRRVKLKNGQVYTTRYGVPSTWRVDPTLIASKGEIDPDLIVVRVEDLSGQVIAAISNFACHPSVALLSSNVSGDFFGEAAAILENILGDNAFVLTTNGAAGDVDPTLEMPVWGPRNDENARHLGVIFAAQILECLERVQIKDISTIGVSREYVDLDVREEWISLLKTEQERMCQEFSAGWTPSSVMERILEQKKMHTEVQALRIGDLILVGFPGEVFSSIGMKLKRWLPEGSLAVVELANDNVGYLATRKAFSEGGYEVGNHLWGRATPEAEDLLLDAAKRSVGKFMNGSGSKAVG